MSLVLSSHRKDKGDPELRSMRVRRKRSLTLFPYTQSNYITIECQTRLRPRLDNPTDSPALIPSLSGPGVSVCNSSHDAITWRAENRTHLSKKTGPSTQRSPQASNVTGIPYRPDDQLRWVLIVRSQVYMLMGGESHTHRQVAPTMLSI